MPRRYIGSSSIKRIKNGYRGSVQSKKWKHIWRDELKNNPHLFKTRILKIFNTRAEAIVAELETQKRYNVVKSCIWINESYAQIRGYAGRDVSGVNNPMYGQGHKMAQWCANNPEAVRARNRKAALTQWSNPTTRQRRQEAMRGKTKTIKIDPDEFIAMQRAKAAKMKEKTATRIEYNGQIYLGWNELREKTGITKHNYNKFYIRKEASLKDEQNHTVR